MTDTMTHETAAEARRRRFTDGLRELADFLDTHHEVPTGNGARLLASIARIDGDPLAAMAAVASSGGRWEKAVDEAAGTFDLTRSFGPHTLTVFTLRENVCDRRVVATETVTREVPDPDLVALVPRVTVTEEVQRIEWDCPPSLLADRGEATP